MKPVVGLIALGALAFVLITCYSGGSNTVAGANGLCIKLSGYFGAPRQ